MRASVNPQRVIHNPVHIVAFGFGTGLSPVAPGTVGTLLGFPLYWFIMGQSPLIQAVVVAGAFAVGVWICDVTGRAIGEADHSGIVWDEIVCFAMVLCFIPATVYWWIAAFVVFRFFDIVKLWPASWIDNQLKNGAGVMLDDLVAGIFSIVVLLALQKLIN